ncbi:MAG TPA: PQQ-binding-like beta-propeller repeat protein [Vicinamibacteria bacterium]|nr:PQQ-binding-like beta-propeller repeat protein [Vicinamibacteria bacterium]
MQLSPQPRRALAVGALAVVALALAVAAPPPLAAEPWPSFRGPRARGVRDGEDLPTHWDVKTGRNVRFKTAIPGRGHSSPIVWGNRVFLTAAVGPATAPLTLGDTGGIGLADDPGPLSWRLYCLSAADGRMLWDREAFAGPARTKRHGKSSQANATPATDGQTVVAIFGSGGLAAFDHEGGRKWTADLGALDPGLFGDPSSEWGHASSPVIDGGRVFVQVDRHAGSFLAAFDLATGRRIWKVDRDERPVWATPTVHESGGRKELVVVGGYHVRGYDPRDGRELWRFKDEAEVKTPTPFAAGGLLVFAGGYRGRPMFALKLGARGDVSVPEEASRGPFLAWRTERGGPYTSTPVAYDGLLYAIRDEGIAVAHELATGRRVYQERTHATHSASPVASDGRIYLAAETGEVLVLKAGESFEVLARNDMGEPCMATPAIAGGTLFVRTLGHLYGIATTAGRLSDNGR